MLQDRWARTVLISVFIEGLAMFGGLAYVGADLHQRFGLSLGVVGALLASFGAGALFYSITAGRMVKRLGQPGLAAFGAVALAAGYATLGLSCRGRGSPFPPSPSSGSASTCCTTRCRPTPRRWRPRLAGFPCRSSPSRCSRASRRASRWPRPVMDRYGGQPIFLLASVIILAIAFWFRRQLVVRMRKPA